ncbi:hypothetical protein XM38_012000 [Halomicronema hongdechloris C2206]|uniref:GIY-YIG domain-containing protein n=1 Tax=Halomicronema hongdechloris C2206 TaxID=1641165 RepID=A0A1Z3HJ03_9CYAN|nr:hypothetical protein [Halomicronema hongdechloris]ASC70263.1 hypothetical protein XM38_012000 [Halomicronema hongdechloris C2206]
MAAEYQLSFLSEGDQKAAELSWVYNQTPTGDLSLGELQGWKQRVLEFQRSVRATPVVRQGTLFDVTATSDPLDALDPFHLPQRNAEFWRGCFDESGPPALYFVVDHELPLLLYVGETIKSNQRWQGEHDCKRYILNYIAAHRPHGLPVTVNIGFWPYAPCDRKTRQALELALIQRWRSPFNKENWRLWGTPFVGSRAPE